MSEQKTRQHETVVEINATPEQVWESLTDPHALTLWLAPEAKVQPGVGGSIYVSWGPGMEGTQQIEIWEPGRHLRLIEDRDHPHGCEPAMEKGPKTEVHHIVCDYYIEAKDGKTVLRLVHSGFGADASWDGEYYGTERGWKVFFETLKHGLERHPGKQARQVDAFLPVKLAPAEAWRKLVDPDALTVGAPFRLDLPAGEGIEGIVRMKTGTSFIGTSTVHDGLVMALAHPVPAGCLIFLSHILYGEPKEEQERVASRFKTALEAVYQSVQATKG